MNLPLAGGFTFAADPARDCVWSDYMWTAAADPYVLPARVLPQPCADMTIDLRGVQCFGRQHDGRQHVRIDLPDGTMRLDLVEGMIAAGAVCIEPAVDLCRPLEPQFASVRRLAALRGGEPSATRDQRFVRLVEALRAADALAAGASLREIALGTIGSDWPGDGEYLKSCVRRRVALAADLKRAGPARVLGWGI